MIRFFQGTEQIEVTEERKERQLHEPWHRRDWAWATGKVGRPERFRSRRLGDAKHVSGQHCSRRTPGTPGKGRALVGKMYPPSITGDGPGSISKEEETS